MIFLTDVFKNSETGGSANWGFHGDTAHSKKKPSLTINLISKSRL